MASADWVKHAKVWLQQIEKVGRVVRTGPTYRSQTSEAPLAGIDSCLAQYTVDNSVATRHTICRHK